MYHLYNSQHFFQIVKMFPDYNRMEKAELKQISPKFINPRRSKSHISPLEPSRLDRCSAIKLAKLRTLVCMITFHCGSKTLQFLILNHFADI